MINTKSFVSNGKMLRPKRKRRPGTTSLEHGGYHLELPPHLPQFVHSTTGWHSGISATDNGAATCNL